MEENVNLSELSTENFISLIVNGGEIKKEDILLKSAEIANKICENGQDAIFFESMRRRLMELFKQVGENKRYKKYLIEEIKLYKRIQRNGVEFIVKENGVSYDYSDDPMWTTLKAKLTAREAYLKALPISGEVCIDPDTGEQFTARRPVRKSSESVEGTIL